MVATLRWMRTHAVPAVVGAVAGIALAMVLFREVHWSWFPQSDTDQWAVAGVVGVVLGGVMTEWPSRARSQETDAANEPIDGEAGQSVMTGDKIRIGRTGRATATGGGEASTGVRGAGRSSRIRVRRTGDAKAEGPGSKASTGVEYGPQE
jgi:hypothetical protein